MQIPNRTYNISAETESEQEEWITALTMATSMLEDSKVHVYVYVYTCVCLGCSW